jgi:hypothetical protein
MPAKEHAPYRFTAKVADAGGHAIALEPLDSPLSVLSHFKGLLTLNLRPGLTIHEARALARLLNERIDGLGAAIP